MTFESDIAPDQTVYLRTDPSKHPRIITAVSFQSGGGIRYGLGYGAEESFHFRSEIVTDKDIPTVGFFNTQFYNRRMGKFIEKPKEVEAISFDEFMQHAKATTEHPHWAPTYEGVNFTQEKEGEYLFMGQQGVEYFRAGDMLVTVGPQSLVVMSKADFDAKYSKS